MSKLQAIRSDFDRNVIRRLFKTVAVSGANTPALADFAMDLENAARAIRMRIDIHREKRRLGITKRRRKPSERQPN